MNGDEKIRKNSHFRFIYSRGRSFSDSYLVLYIFRNGKSVNRLGISVSKKVGKSVVRSRVKRLIKENFRLNKDSFQKGYDVIFIARVKSANANFYDIEKSMLYLMRKSGLLKAGDNK